MNKNILGNIDMVNGPLFKNIWAYTIPAILTGILQLLFNAVNLVVVGRYCGSLSVAAVGSTGAIINLVINLFIGLSVGVGVIVATALGTKDEEKVRSIVHTSIPVALTGGIALALIGLVITTPLLRLMSTPDDVIDLAAIYMKIYFCGMPGSLLYNYGAAVLRADGDTRTPLLFLALAGVVNVVLNLIFVIFLKMDVAGAALATSISQTLSAILVLGALTRRKGPCRLNLSAVKIEKAALVQMLKIGLPAGLQGSMFSISNVIIQGSVNSFGSIAMSGNAAAANLEGFIIISMNAFHLSAMNFTAQNYGAGKLERVPKIRRCCLLNVFLVGELMGIPTYLAADKLLGIYITDSPEAIKAGIMRMSFVCLLYGLCGLQDVATGVLRGLGASLAPTVVSVFGICVFRIIWIFTIFQIPRFHNLQMLYVTYPLSWILTFVLLNLCYRTAYKNRLLYARQMRGE